MTEPGRMEDRQGNTGPIMKQLKTHRHRWVLGMVPSPAVEIELQNNRLK